MTNKATVTKDPSPGVEEVVITVVAETEADLSAYMTALVVGLNVDWLAHDDRGPDGSWTFVVLLGYDAAAAAARHSAQTP